MTRIKIRKDIEIERNLIEKFLMKLRDSIMANRKRVKIIFFGVLILIVFLLGSFWKFSSDNHEHLVKFETIMENYRKNKDTDKSVRKKTIDGLKQLSGKTHFGFVHEMVDYIIGNLYYSEKEYKNAISYLEKFSNDSSYPVFKPIALQKAAIAYEELGDLDGAMRIYIKLESDYSESVVADQILYNIGRIHMIKKDMAQAKKYFNRVISTFPRSVFANKAAKRQLLAGLEN